MTAPAPGWVSQHHDGSHRDLLRAVSIAVTIGAQVGMIAVPTSRPVRYLAEAVRLAEKLGSTLLVLASGRSHARQVEEVYGHRLAGRLIAIDVPPGYAKSQTLFRFEADAIAAGVSPRVSDISVKRNIALVIARALDVERLFFLDDDLLVPDWRDVRRAAGAVGWRHRAAGLTVGGFLDNSVVCHAHRLTGGRQETFVGAGALMMDPRRARAFFPNVYNEDWLYLLEWVAEREVATVGFARQREHDPFITPNRARREEFGDVLAESLYWLVEAGGTPPDADETFWAAAIARRRLFIGEVRDRVPTVPVPPSAQRRIAVALDAAVEVQDAFSPSLCAGYVRAWLRDRHTWAERLDGLSGVRTLGSVLETLELTSCVKTALDQGLPIRRRRRGPLRRGLTAGKKSEVEVPVEVPHPGAFQNTDSSIAVRG